MSVPDAPETAPEGVKRGTGQETDSEGAETILEAEGFPAPTLEAVA